MSEALPIGVHGDPAGGPVIATQEWFRVDGLPVVRKTDPVTPHGDSPHDSALMAVGSEWHRVDGLAVSKETDPATCGDPLVSSKPWYRVSPP